MNYRGNKIVGIRKMAARRLERDICSFRLKSCKEIGGEIRTMDMGLVLKYLDDLSENNNWE